MIPREIAKIIAEYSSEYYCKRLPCRYNGVHHWSDDEYYYFNYCNKARPRGFVTAQFSVEDIFGILVSRKWHQEHQILAHVPVELIRAGLANWS